MNNNLLLSLAVSVIPIFAIVFVGILLLHKIYVKIRSKFSSTVNCWFCNQNTKVPYLEANSWTCPHCEQYNGFTKDGDYNREMFQQLDCSNASDQPDHSSELFTRPPPRNGFCNVCNEAQRLKVEKLAQFEPKNESHFDAELKAYKAQLEEQYRLCATCDRHLNKVLREKKKMVLGSKFLDFIIKGAETLKQPHFKQLQHAKKLHWKLRFSLFISLLAVFNIFCLFSHIPTLTRSHLTELFGKNVGEQLFLASSHLLAFCHVVAAYLEDIGEHHIVVKIGLFLRTIFMMILYSMGLKLPQLVRFNFPSVYVLASPFVILSLAFGHNIMDGFRLTRFTFLLVLWSTLAGGLFSAHLPISPNSLMFISSVVTLLLSSTVRIETSPKLHDNTASSFHKIYSEDYFSDEETISMLSQQLDSSAGSVRSRNTNRSFQQRASPPQQTGKAQNLRFQKSPVTSSTFSLHQLPAAHSQLSPNSSFRSFCLNDAAQPELRSPYAGSVLNFANATVMSPRSSVYASTRELDNRERPHSTLFGLSANNSAANNSFANNSFSTTRAQPQNHSDEGRYLFSPAGTGSLQATQSAFPAMVDYTANGVRTLHSPFSFSSKNVYPQQPQRTANNLLSPSRFSTNSLAGRACSPATTSWLSGGYFNQQRPVNNNSTRPSNALFEHRNGPMTAIDENLSRASSQSSGFESQNGRCVNYSRENSFCAETADLLQRTKSLLDNPPKAFQPIEPRAASLLSPSSNLTQPLSVNCSTTSSTVWGAPLLRKSLHSRDSFNLRKIDKELPTIKRGDLLKKWKESQGIS